MAARYVVSCHNLRENRGDAFQQYAAKHLVTAQLHVSCTITVIVVVLSRPYCLASVYCVLYHYLSYMSVLLFCFGNIREPIFHAKEARECERHMVGLLIKTERDVVGVMKT